MKKALLILILLVAPIARAEPAFFIESIQVEGASSSRIVIAESRLREGQLYDEAELRDAVARIQRLPFVVSTDFRLAKGSEVDKYVLVISVRQMKPFFLNASSTTRWTPLEQFTPTPQGLEKTGDVVDQARRNEVVAGARTFVQAARLLDIQRTYLHQKIAALDIPKPRRGEEE